MKTIKTRGKQLLYGAAGLGVNMLNLMMGSYLCSALIAGGFDVADLPFHTFEGKDLVIASVWAIFVVIAKIIDGIIDIPMASWADNLRSKWGRRRPAIFIGMIVMVIAYLLFLVVPNPTGVTWVNTIYFGVVLCVFYAFYTLTMVTYYATYTEIVEDVDSRNFISNVKSVCDVIYFILGYVLVAGLLNGLNIKVVAVIVLPLVLTMTIPLFMIKEKSTKNNPEHEAKSVGLFKSLKYTLKNKQFLTWMCVYSFMTFGTQLFLGGINEYFSATEMSMMIVMGATFAPVPLGLFVYNKVIKKYGFGIAFRYILLLYAIGMTGVFFVGMFVADTMLKTVLSICGGVIISFAIGALFSVAYSIPAQLAAEDEEQTGISHSAMYFAVQGLFSGVATGIATGLVLTALKVNTGAIFYMTLISGAGCLIAFGLMFLLSKKLKNLGKK